MCEVIKLKKNILRIIVPFILSFLICLLVIEAPRIETTTIVTDAKTFKDPIVVNYVNKIEINYNQQKARLSPAYTYNEVRFAIEKNWTFADNLPYNQGNNNIWINYCPTSAKCNLDETTIGYDEQVKADRYTWVNFEIYIKDCPQDSEQCENDFDPEHLNEIEVYLNGVKQTETIVKNYNTSWHCVDVYVPVLVDNSSFVEKITVQNDTKYVTKGTTSAFTVDVDYYGDGYDSITWSVIDNAKAGTTINQSGVLTVAADETAETIIVRATSTKDNTVYGEKAMTILDTPLSIDRVEINPKTKTVVYGGQFQFSANAVGTASPAVIWSISGANKSGTTIDENGVLTVAADETTTSITVTATSVYDNTKSASATVNARATEIINKIEFSYNPEKVVFSSKATYNQIRSSMERNIVYPEEAGYDKGNNNVGVLYCSSSTKCDYSDATRGYGEQAMSDRYTYLDVEVYAKPNGKSYDPNPEYDFDPEHLNEIEVWINGVKRDDAIVSGYNDAWREVDVIFPITITDEKLPQEMGFSYDVYNTEYGSTFKNYLYHNKGDGEITYESSDTSVATIDSEGNVTINKIGTCIITATASETDAYRETSISYTINAEPQYVYPTISGYQENYDYTGEGIMPEITVTYNNEITLVKDTDYTISYGENTNAGYATITINPVEGSNYTFSEKTATFYINRKSIGYEDITINPTSIEYTGEALTVDVTIVVDGRTLIKDTDYTLSFTSNTNVGTAYVNVTGINNYQGYQYKTFEITEAPEYQKGDLNKDGNIGLTDIIYLLKRYLSIEETTTEDILIGDMNEDGNLGLTDIILLLRVYLGIA